MTTLIIKPDMYYTRFRMKGLSLKRADMQELCKDETGFFIDNRFKLNGKTALIDKARLVELLEELYKNIPFDKIKIDGHYEATGEELMSLIKIHT